MKNLISLAATAIAFLCIAGNLNAQENSVIPTERYILIEDISTFFVADESDSNIILCSFDLYNILENESSKPVFVGVNELSEVVKFSIKANSEKFENRRSCVLKMNPQNYLSTFRLVLDRMKVEKVLYKGEFLPVNEFFDKIM